MYTLKGKSVFGGIAIGRISVFDKGEVAVVNHQVEDVEAELARLRAAREKAAAQLQALYDKALKEVGEANAAIFEVHQMMLEDLDYVESMEGMVTDQNACAEYAVQTTGESFAQIFASMDDEYMKARSADVKDISARVVNILMGRESEGLSGTEPVILMADDLAPSETVQLDKDMVLSFVTRHGSTNSHTAILARTMSIPALIGVDFSDDLDGKMAIVDGSAAQVIVEPDENTLAEYRQLLAKQQHQRELLRELKGQDNVTTDGRRINVYANIGGVGDVASVLDNDAGGIGLFRSEFLYLESEDYPTEAQQFEAYKAVAVAMGGKKVIIRTLDIGADKQVDYFQMEKEENPALGYRAIRICLDRPGIFKTQLRALYRASNFGTISIMIPMIISVDEVRQVKAIIEEVKTELTSEGYAYGDVELGIMIETPAAVMISDLLAEEVDFFSVGTNDLTQYTLAIDRQNSKLEAINDTHHPAIMRMLQMIVDNAHAHNAWAGICGELGADTTLTKTFVDMGYDELSVSPSRVLDVRAAVRAI